MIEIDKHIEQLLHEHDCVIVPDFGGFITSKKSAFYNPYTSVFFPATKKILFNKHLVFNDCLLAGKMAEKGEFTMAEAQQLLIQFKDECFLKLDNEGRVEIERVGVLFFDKEKNIQFQQSSVNFLKDSFGLNPVSLGKVKKPVVNLNQEIAPVIISRPKEEKKDRIPIIAERNKEERNKRRSGVLIPLLIIPLLLGGLFMLNQQSELNKSNLNMANLNPFYSAPVETYIPRDGKTFLVTDLTVNEGQNVIVSAEESIKIESIESSQVSELIEEKVKLIPAAIDSTYNESIKFKIDKKYHVIAGCFSVKENAENYVIDWTSKGNESKIVDKKGRLYRVAIQSFETRKEAKKFLKRTKKSEKISLWILKK